MTSLHVELSQIAARYREQLAAHRRTVSAADQHATDDVIKVTALLAVLRMYDWSDDAREQAADYCGVPATSRSVIGAVTSAAYREAI